LTEEYFLQLKNILTLMTSPNPEDIQRLRKMHRTLLQQIQVLIAPQDMRQRIIEEIIVSTVDIVRTDVTGLTLERMACEIKQNEMDLIPSFVERLKEDCQIELNRNHHIRNILTIENLRKIIEGNIHGVWNYIFCRDIPELSACNYIEIKQYLDRTPAASSLAAEENKSSVQKAIDLLRYGLSSGQVKNPEQLQQVLEELAVLDNELKSESKSAALLKVKSAAGSSGSSPVEDGGATASSSPLGAAVTAVGMVAALTSGTHCFVSPSIVNYLFALAGALLFIAATAFIINRVISIAVIVLQALFIKTQEGLDALPLGTRVAVILETQPQIEQVPGKTGNSDILSLAARSMLGKLCFLAEELIRVRLRKLREGEVWALDRREKNVVEQGLGRDRLLELAKEYNVFPGENTRWMFQKRVVTSSGLSRIIQFLFFWRKQKKR